MNSRRWVIFLVTFVVIVVVAFQIVWRVFSLDDKLRSMIIAQLKSKSISQIDIGKVSADFNSLNFHDISFRLPNTLHELKIAKLELGFSIFNFLKYNLNPVRFISEVVLDKPVVVLKENTANNTPADSLSTFKLDSLESRYRNKLIDFGFVGRIIINNGSVIWSSNDSTDLVMLNQLKGWLSTTDLEHSVIRMKGKLFRSEKDNIELTGVGDLTSGRIDSVLINFNDDELSTTIPTLFPDVLKVESGELHGGGVLRQSAAGKLILNGYISLQKAQLDLFDNKLTLENLNTEAFIQNWDVIIKSCQLDCDQSKITISGTIKNLLKPAFDLAIHSDDLKIKELAASFIDPENKLGIAGVANVDLSLTTIDKKSVISGKVVVPSLSVKAVQFDRVESDFSYADKALKINSISGLYRNFKLQNSGEIDFIGEKPVFDFNIHAIGDLKSLLPGFFNAKIETTPFDMQGTLSGNFADIKGLVNIKLAAKFSDRDSIPIEGRLQLDNRKIKISAFYDGQPFQLKADLDISGEQVKIDGRIDRFGGRLWEMTGLPVAEQLKNLVDVSLLFTGDQKYATYSILTHRKDYTGDSDLLFRIDGFYNVNGGGTKINGKITYFPGTGGEIPGEIKATVSKKFFTLEKYELGDFYRAAGRINFTGSREVSGRFNISQADLAYIFDGIFLKPNFEMFGKISGNIDLSGTMDQPVFQGNLNLQNGIIRASGYYSGDTQFLLENKKLTIRKSQLQLDQKKLMDVAGNIDFGKKEYNLKVQGSGVKTSLILNLFIGGLNFVHGKSDFNLTVTDRLSNPNIAGKIITTNGRLFFVDFDSLYLDVGKDLNSGQAQLAAAGPGFHIQNAHLVKKNKYTIDGRGYLPFSENDDMDLTLSGTGDGFAILFANEPFVKGSDSKTTFSWGFGGTYSSIIYTEGKVSLTDGMLQLADLTPKVENIKIEAELEPMNQFLRFDKVTGIVRKQPIFMESSLDSLTVSQGLQPLIIKSWGLNFGVIRIATDKKGVPLHIPGLMEAGDEGWFVVQGRDRERYFTVSGPAEHPLVRGRILAHNATITYPFIVEEGDTSEPDLTEQILESMIWDLDLIPINDVRYVKKIPGLIDNVWIDVYIDPKISHLTFSGIIADESFRVDGIVQTTRGSIEYLNLNFNVVKFAAEFDKSDIFPVTYGKAMTTISDENGNPSNIYLTLFVYDKNTKQELERGRWSDDIRFRLSSDNPTIGNNERQILAELGYTASTIDSYGMIGISTDNLIFRPLFRPVERKLERALRLDVIRFHAHFARNLVDMIQPRDPLQNSFGASDDPSLKIDPRYLLFRSTQLMVGKYFSNNIYFVYSGQLEAGQNRLYRNNGIGIKHSLDLEYRILPNLLLELQYNYDSLLLSNRVDKRIQLKHSFNF
ncbi:MAG TPA: hypothetical protein ENH29_06565 [Bacteroidetes bacterium]|nr:hypothetical protein [Bacteroidota bacterium]